MDKIALLDSNGTIFMGNLQVSEISIYREIKSNEGSMVFSRTKIKINFLVLGSVTALNFSLNCKYFAIGYNSGAVKVFNTDKGSLRYQCVPVSNRRGILDIKFTELSYVFTFK